jgi:hypothetical protein
LWFNNGTAAVIEPQMIKRCDVRFLEALSLFWLFITPIVGSVLRAHKAAEHTGEFKRENKFG